MPRISQMMGTDRIPIHNMLNSQASTCQSWQIKVFFSSHGSAWTATSKWWKNIPFVWTLQILWRYYQYHRIFVEFKIILGKFFRKIILFRVFTYLYIVTFVSIVLRSTTGKQIFIYQKLFKVQENYFLGSNFINLSENLQ